MIVMNLELDNFLAFKDFKINFSYPKKIVNTPLPNEFLKGKPKFRYKRVNVLMGSNATGKTSIGEAIMSIVNFIDKKEIGIMTKRICDKDNDAKFSMDYLLSEDLLIRITCTIKSEYHNKKLSEFIILDIFSCKINKSDTYETCVAKLKNMHDTNKDNLNYIAKLDLVPSFGWFFSFPSDRDDEVNNVLDEHKSTNIVVLNKVLKLLDPSILEVAISKELEDTYIIKYSNQDILVEKGVVLNKNALSSGTLAGLDIAYIVASIYLNRHGFYFCDEKFTFIQSEIEIAIFSLMIDLLKENSQLFLTTHNLDLLEMNLPTHSFTFLKKNKNIEVVNPENFIKKNNVSLRNAVENDLFGISPDLSNLYKLKNELEEDDL